MALDLFRTIDVQLNGTNYTVWATSLTFYLRGIGLWGHITDIDEFPQSLPQSLPSNDGTSTSDKTHVARDQEIRAWRLADDRAMSIIAQTVAPSIRLQLRRFDIAKEIWKYLSSVYTQSNTAREYQLSQHISDTSQGDMSIQEFYTLLAGYWEELAAMEPQFTTDAALYQDYRDCQLLYHFLMRLKLRGQLLHRNPPPTLETAVSELLHEEMCLQTLASTSSLITGSTSTTTLHALAAKQTSD